MIFGIIILLIGVLMVLNIFVPQLNFNFGMMWPLALIFISLYEMFKNKTFNGGLIILFYIGLYFFIANLKVFGDIGELFFPMLLIVIGLSAIVGEAINKKDVIVPTMSKEGILTYSAIFTDYHGTIDSKDFKGAYISCLFGDADLDLRGITLKRDAVITVKTIFGGSNLIMPNDCHVVMRSNAFFGGNENRCRDTESKDAKTIYVNCTSFFGGTELK